MLERIRNFQGADQLDLFGPQEVTIAGRVADALFRLGKMFVR